VKERKRERERERERERKKEQERKVVEKDRDYLVRPDGIAAVENVLDIIYSSPNVARPP
jgi:hypothetical protein